MALPHCILQGCAVLIFSSDGKMKTKFGSRGSESGQFAGPHYVTANSHGNIIVSDFHNHTVKVSCQLPHRPCVQSDHNYTIILTLIITVYIKYYAILPLSL